MSDHPLIPKSNTKIVPPFIPKPKESLESEVARLKAEVERLRKAGDYLADHLAHEFGTCPSIEIWNAAKEGKQP